MKSWVAAAFVLLAASGVRADSDEEHDYILHCAGCHRMDGAGSRLVPSLHRMSELAGKEGARAYWVQVPGAAQAPLSNARLAALMNWVVERFTGKRPSPPYEPDEVGALRAKPLRDPIAKRGELQRAQRGRNR